jgi:hypothetical protein
MCGKAAAPPVVSLPVGSGPPDAPPPSTALLRSEPSSQCRINLYAAGAVGRYLLHVLPEHFVRIRHFGFLANRVRSKNLELAREQLGSAVPQHAEPEQGCSLSRCPSCHVGSMITIQMIDPQPLEAIDSS